MSERLTLLDISVWGGFASFAISSVVIPVCLPEISNSISVNFSESGSLESFRNTIVLAFLVLSIVIIKFFSKKQFIAQGQYLISLGLFSASFANTYFAFAASIILMGIGGGLSEAFINPLVVDLHPNNSGKFLNLTNAFYPIGVVVSSLLFGEMLTHEISWRIIFRTAAIFSLLIAVLLSLQGSTSDKKPQKLSLKNYAEIIMSGKFWLFAVAIFLGGSIEAAYTFWGRSFVEVYLSDVPRSGTLAVTIFAISMFIGRLLTSFFTSKYSLKKIIFSSSILGIIVGFILPYADSILEFNLLISLSGLATACLWPSILSEASSILNFDKTILMILLACAGVIGFGFTPLLMGIIGDNSQLKYGFILAPIFFSIIIGLMHFENKS
ncbi:MAG: MFS transporter [Ignavibacteriales bacterium]|nr:MFS transporter [Ignavibacteriales bacterium]MCB9218383.1 MFS transporter [Ignavibacteriales bacterium]